MAVDFYLPGLTPGQGVNLALQTEHGTAIDGDLSASLPDASGIEVVYLLTVIRSYEQLMQAFSLSASVSYSALFVSASASASFLTQSSFSRYRTYVVGRCIVSLPDRSIKEPKLKAEVLGQAKAITKDQFTQIYGSEFLRGIQAGGAYFGVIEIESTSSEEQEQIAVAVSASGWGFSADVSISKQLEQVTKTMSKRVFVVRQGGPPSLQNPSTADEIIKQAASFPQAVSAAPVVIKGIYQRYDQAFDIAFKGGQQPFDWDKRQSDLQVLGQRYLKLKQLRNDYEFVVQHYNDYLTGSGVVFELGGEALTRKPIHAVEPGILKSVKAESDSPGGDAPASEAITIEAITKELAEIEKKLLEVVNAADSCKSGKPYAMPAPYVAKIGLPKIKGKNMELELIKKQLVPMGTIAMWSGPANAIPEGWFLCDGTNGTPDLRDRFVRGADPKGDPKPLSAGDADHHSHYARPPSFNATADAAGEHAHRFPSSWYHRGLDDGKFNGIDTNQQTLNLNPTTQGAGQHGHTVPISMPAFSTDLSTDENKPRWFALCFVMKGPVA